MTRDGPVFRNAARQSRLTAIVRSGRHSIIVALVQAVAAFITRVSRNSYLYRWLTTEPDPDVIVIDLTETWSVGPLIRVIDRVVRIAIPIWASARLKQAFERFELLGERLASGSVSLHVLARLLAPPSETDSGKDRH